MTGRIRSFSLLHSRLHCYVLPEDASEHASPGESQLHSRLAAPLLNHHRHRPPATLLIDYLASAKLRRLYHIQQHFSDATAAEDSRSSDNSHQAAAAAATAASFAVLFSTRSDPDVG